MASNGNITGIVGSFMGVSASEYTVLIIIGPILDKVFVDPRFHRVHHMMATPEEPHIHDCNFALVLPIWDIIFRTARYDLTPRQCGVDDPTIDADNDYFWAGQQWRTFRRFWRELTKRRTRQEAQEPEPAE
ncbi:sterol desaturase family protein [Methylovirgula sp. 4M-Z18]|uniref:sterol desaturase family protein n=1 Tax=Methylovirgula sp. 4M-Z18 TaxID=2293567 RepID=UPI000E3A7F5F|nr:sterol desaturase family protein [Methylovirgula sp. 4M-Z18]RFB80566.1 fatty acid hydroxylase family protein [Methylovirgula sp. 4M-Z18]